MKLAFALFNFFPFGGLTRDMLAIARACRRRGHRVRIYAGEFRGDSQAANEPNAIHESPETQPPLDSHPRSGRGQALRGNDGPLPIADDLEFQLVPSAARTNHGKNRRFAEQLPGAVAAFSPHLIVGFNKMPGLDIYYAADDCFADKSRRRGWLYRMTPRCRQSNAFELAVFARDCATEILLIAPNQQPVFRRHYDTPATRITLLPPGISRDRIAGDDAPVRRRRFRHSWHLDDDGILLLAVGSGFRTKGLDRTLAAFAALPAKWRERAHLLVVGGGKTRRFETIARRLNIHSRVRFTGAREDVPEFLLAADLLMHPARHEAGGIVLLEALVAGLPVIATDVCGYAHYIRNAAMGDILASPFEQSGLNRALRGILERLDAERDTWRARGRDFAARADIYHMPQHACARIEAVADALGRHSREGGNPNAKDGKP